MIEMSWIPILYFLIGLALTVYWNSDNDGLINDTIMFGWLLWPVFLVWFTPEFLSDIKFNRVERERMHEWNERKGVGLRVEFMIENKALVSGKTIKKAYFVGVMGACITVRDDVKDGKYNIDYICPLSILRICGGM